MRFKRWVHGPVAQGQSAGSLPEIAGSTPVGSTLAESRSVLYTASAECRVCHASLEASDKASVAQWLRSHHCEPRDIPTIEVAMNAPFRCPVCGWDRIEDERGMQLKLEHPSVGDLKPCKDCGAWFDAPLHRGDTK